MNPKLHLYVWDEVLCDYTCGIMFALAYSVEQARELLLERDNLINIAHLQQEPKVYNEPTARVVWGGE